MLSMLISLFGLPAHAGLPLADSGYVAPRIMSGPCRRIPLLITTDAPFERIDGMRYAANEGGWEIAGVAGVSRRIRHLT